MWRQVLGLVCAVEAGLLAAVLFVVVIEPGIALSPRERQFCAIGALALGAGCCYGLVRWLRAVVASRAWLDL